MQGGTAGRFRADVQGLRAVAVVLVVAYHVGLHDGRQLVPGGFTGVDVFFVISGYVITRMLTAELSERSGIALGRFYLRRIRRILPALAVLLVVVIPASQVLGPVGGTEATVATGRAAAVSVANLWLAADGAAGYFDPASELDALLHTWSLSVEEQFYLGFPLLLLAAWRLAGRARRPRAATAAVVVAVASVASFAASAVLTLVLASDDAARWGFYAPVTRAWEFGAGALVALAAARTARLPRPLVPVTSAAGVALVALGAFAVDDAVLFPGTAALLPVVGTALLLAAGEGRTGAVATALAWRPLRWLGDRSYSWYLWHWPAIVFAAALWPSAPRAATIAGAASLLPAWLSHRLIERPVRLAAPPARRTLALGACCALVPLAVATATSARGPDPSLERFEVAFARHEDGVDRCGAERSDELGAAGSCAHRVAASTGRAVLLGDSNAGHLASGFVAAANAEGLDAVVSTRPSCPFADVVVEVEGDPDEACRSLVTTTLDALLDDPPDVVVLGGAGDIYLGTDQRRLVDPAPGTGSSGTELEAWTAGLGRVAGQLEDAGTDVVLVQAPPRFPGWEPRACAVARWRADPGSCGVAGPADDPARRAEAVADALDEVAASTGATVVEPFPVLCPGEVCATLVGETWLYRDGTHLSTAGSRALGTALGDAMDGTGDPDGR